jgi:OOP family OmpA-OmpF porin
MQRSGLPGWLLAVTLTVVLVGCAGGAHRRSAAPAVAPVDHAAHALADLTARVGVALPGCAVEARDGAVRAVVPAGRLFEPDTTTLAAAGGTAITPLVQLLRGCRDCDVQVIAYTDAIGPAADNQQFSARRAEALVAWMQAAGVAAARRPGPRAREADPVAGQDGPAGRQANRRIEIIIRP